MYSQLLKSAVCLSLRKSSAEGIEPAQIHGSIVHVVGVVCPHVCAISIGWCTCCVPAGVFCMTIHEYNVGRSITSKMLCSEVCTA